MELLFLGLTALLCAPLLEKKQENKPPEKSGDSVIVVVVDKDGKPKAEEGKPK